MVAWSKANPGKLSYATSGASSPLRLIVEQLKLRTGLDATFVNYKTSSAFIPDLIAGRVTLGLTAVGNSVPLISAGKVKAIMMTQPNRNDLVPDVPSTADVGHPDLDAGSWFSLHAPSKTPRAIVERLGREVIAILQLPDVQAGYRKLGATPVWDATPDQFRKKMESEIANWTRVVREAKLKFD